MKQLDGIQIDEIVESQHIFFNSQETKQMSFRLEMLRKLKSSILRYDREIKQSLWQDLHKSEMEVFVFETGPVIKEIDLHLKHLKKWMKPHRVKTPMQFLPSRSYANFEPLGVAFIIGPFNYPLNLLITPLIGAISSGCCSVIKPSYDTPNLSQVIDKLIAETFDQKYIAVIQGDLSISEYLLAKKFDFIFFTGSPRVGKIIMKAASLQLTPIVLELGGKSPCIVNKEANIPTAARRIIWGKTINAGQTCVAPDYLFAHSTIKDQLIEQMILSIDEMYGPDIRQSQHYARIISRKSVERLKRLMDFGNIRFGGEIDEQELFISPTIIDNILPEFPIMKEEIFGPILPVLIFDEIEEVISFINSNEKPLALYYFGNRIQAKRIFQETSSGGGCINDTFQHIGNLNLPFGGVGNSGFGRYHGKETFLAFSNQKSIMDSSSFIEFPFKYPPYRYEKVLKRVL